MTIVYDGSCPFCVRCAGWLCQQDPAVSLRVVPSSDPVLAATWAHVPGFGVELTVIADTGQVWTGPDAFIVALWCLARYRHLALAMSGPTAHRAARRFFGAVSDNRGNLARVLGNGDCPDGVCLR